MTTCKSILYQVQDYMPLCSL